MFLSQLIGKTLIFDKTPRGVCLGAGVSLKSKMIKYLFCSSDTTVSATNNADFVLPIGSLASFSEDALFLARLRPVLPKPCGKLYIGLPVYNAEGASFGFLSDVELQNYVAIRLFTDKNIRLPFSSIAALADAVILRKPQPYPLGQPIPDDSESLVTKQVLRNAVQNQTLIKLTLSLPPFQHPFG
ncbi:MAG: hypothetical protein IJ329_03735 [Clostridia bacterium]|nr:hypothetical protein [Clostridia bacterium]